MKIDLLSIILYDHLPIGNGQVHGHTLRPYCKPVSCFSEIERSQKNTVNERMRNSRSHLVHLILSRSPRAPPAAGGLPRILEYRLSVASCGPRSRNTTPHKCANRTQPSNNAITTVRRTLLFDAPAFVELCSMHSSSWSCPLHLTSPTAYRGCHCPYRHRHCHQIGNTARWHGRF